jgi:hypothetical protein
MRTLRSQHGTLDAFLRFSKLMLVDISAAWQRAEAEQRFCVQKFLFRDGVAYHQTQKFLNTSNATLFQQLRALTHPESTVGVPGLTQFAPLLPENYSQLNRLQAFIGRFTRPADGAA